MSDPHSISPMDLGMATGLAGLIGAAIRWLFTRKDERATAREMKFAAWERRLIEREGQLEQGRTAYTHGLEQRLSRIEAEEEARATKDAARDDKDAARDAQMTALRIAFELVSGALRKLDPLHTALGQADDILKTAFPVNVITPADMLGSLVTLHEQENGPGSPD